MTTNKTARPARSAKKSSTPRSKPRVTPRSETAAAPARSATKERAPRTDTKQAKLIAMLKTNRGATIEEIATALDWQPHTVRGALAGALRKRLGLDVSSGKVEGRGRVYRITD